MKKLFLLMFALSSLNVINASELQLAPPDYVEEQEAVENDLVMRTRLEPQRVINHPFLARHFESYDEFFLVPGKPDEGIVLKTDFDEGFVGESTLYRFKIIASDTGPKLELTKLFNCRNLIGIYMIRGRLLAYYRNLSGYEVKVFID